MTRTIRKEIEIDLPPLTLNDVKAYLLTASVPELEDVSHLVTDEYSARLQAALSAPFVSAPASAMALTQETAPVAEAQSAPPPAASLPAAAVAAALAQAAARADSTPEPESETGPESDLPFVRLSSKGKAIYVPAGVARALGLKAGHRAEIIPTDRRTVLRFHYGMAAVGARLNAVTVNALQLSLSLPHATNLASLCPRAADDVNYRIDLVEVLSQAQPQQRDFEMVNVQPLTAAGK